MEEKWTTVIRKNTNFFSFDFGELMRYRDLILLMFKKKYTTRYKQTILGPLWLVVTPFLTTVIFSVVFGGLAGLSTDGSPQILFYMSGNILWTLFSTSVTNTSATFVDNAEIFGKVYFPRVVTPIASVMTAMTDFLIQLVLFLVILVCLVFGGYTPQISPSVVLLPLLVFQVGLLGIGLGNIISSITVKYRDLFLLVSFCLQLWMYLSPVVYSTSLIPDRWYGLYMVNPMAPVMVVFRHMFLGTDVMPWGFWGLSWLVTAVVSGYGLLVFNKTQRTFMDTV
jgi:lipopolysaccharide transport system permease protein